jgi:DNA replication protein
VRKALEALTEENVLLHLPLKHVDKTEDVYFLNNEANRLAIDRIRNGEIVLPDLKYEKVIQAGPIEAFDIFSLYEQNIGILTPLIADELKEACKRYPEAWIRDAVKEAVSLNKRNWRYIARILEHWLSEGKDNGTYQGNNKKNEDPDKYIRGKYGHMVQR